MLLGNALKLAAKHGAVTKEGPDAYRVEVNADNVVLFRAGHNGPADMLRHNRGEHVPPEVTEVVHRWRDELRRWVEMGCRTLAGALGNAKYRQTRLEHGWTTVVVTETYGGPAVRREVKVTVNGAEVCGRHDEVVRMADGALEAGSPAALLDWVHENQVDRNATTLLV